MICGQARLPAPAATPRPSANVALGHCFGATGARIPRQGINALSDLRAGRLAIVGICTDGSQSTVAPLLEGSDVSDRSLPPPAPKAPGVATPYPK